MEQGACRVESYSGGVRRQSCCTLAALSRPATTDPLVGTIPTDAAPLLIADDPRRARRDRLRRCPRIFVVDTRAARLLHTLTLPRSAVLEGMGGFRWVLLT